MRTLALAVLAALIATADAAPPPAVGYLHVQIDHLPQCEYGVRFEHPWVIELRQRDVVVARADHAGVYLGDGSLVAGLYTEHAVEGRYRIHLGRCPSLHDDPTASVECSTPEWHHVLRAKLRPEGLDSPQIVRLFGLYETCFDGQRSQRTW